MLYSIGPLRYEDISHALSERRSAAASAGMDDAHLLELARQRRAQRMRLLLATWFNTHVRSHIALIALATAAASIALVVAYATLLSREAMPVPAAALFAVLLASTLSSIAGFAFSAICGVMLLQMMSDPVRVVEIMIYCSIAIQSLSVGVLWRECDWRKVMVFLSGGILGLPFGVWLLLHLQHDWFKHAVGMLLILYATTRLLKWRFAITSDNNIVDACVGFLGGITGGLAGFPGAAVTIWCSLKGWDKRRQRGIFQPFILIMQILALLLLRVMRSSAGQGAALGVLPLEFVPVALLGTWFGLVIFRRLSDRSFDLAVNLLLVVSGIGLLA